MIWFLGYCAGIALTTGVILGANAYARELGKDQPFEMDGGYWSSDDAKIKYVTAMCAWPVAWVAYAISSAFRASARRHKRRLELAAEEQKLIEEALR